MLAHVSLQTAPSSHWKAHCPPAHELAQLDPASQTKTHPPPAQEASHVALSWQSMVHPPPSQLGEHVPPEGQVMVHPPVGQAATQGEAHAQPPSGAMTLASQTGSVPSALSMVASPPPSGTTQ
jgi:hypothetical protein